MASDSEKYRVRDERIKRLLLSTDEAKQDEGMEFLDKEFREKVPGFVQKLKRQKAAAAGVLVLIEVVVWLNKSMDDVWQSTLKCVSKNVRNRKYNGKGSLFSYLVKIALCRAADLWSKDQHNDHHVDVTTVAVASRDHDAERMELVEEIERFYDTLSEEDQVTLRLGIALAFEKYSRRGRTAELVEKIVEIRREKGWKEKSPEAIARQYTRLLKRLRVFLGNRGHHV